MATGAMSRAIHCLRHVALVRDGGGMTDGQLLDCFLAGREDAAFTAIVRRHGPMVMGVCQRVLGNRQDAEDAFQATFLVLVRKASSIVPRELVGHWLYGVAYRTALKARAMASRRRRIERQVMFMPEPQARKEEWSDLQLVLDRELNQLPAKYRVPLVLCELEGKSKREIARALRLPEGTVSSRLARGRQMLRRRLIKAGLGLSAGAWAVAMSPQVLSASVPASLVVSTSKAALFVAAGGAATSVISAKVAALTEGVLKAMFMSKLKIATTVLLAIGALGLNVGLFSYHVLAAQQSEGQKQVSVRQDQKRGTAPASAAPAPSKPREPKVVKANEWVNHVAYSPDGKIVASVTWDFEKGSDKDFKSSALKLWDAKTGELKQTLDEYHESLFFFRTITYSQDGKTIAASADGLRDGKGAGEVKVWDVESGALKRTLTHDVHVSCVALSPDGKKVAGGTLFRNEVLLWDADSGLLQKRMDTNKTALYSVAFSPDGKLVVAGGGIEGKLGEITVWEVETGNLKHKWAEPAIGVVYSVAFSPDGTKIASGGVDATTRVWEVETGKLKHLLNAHMVRQVAFSPDGKTLASAGMDNKIRLWDLDSGKEREMLEGHDAQVFSIAFSRDGKFLVSGSSDKTIRLWQLPDRVSGKKK